MSSEEGEEGEVVERVVERVNGGRGVGSRLIL